MQTTTKELERLKVRRETLKQQLKDLEVKITNIENSGFLGIRKVWAKRNQKAYELRKSGMKWEDIAAHFGVSKSVVSKYVYQHIYDHPQDIDPTIIRGWAIHPSSGEIVYAKELA